MVSCEISQGPATVVMDFYAEGDVITKIVQTTDIGIADLSEDDIAMLNEAVEQTEELVSDLDGVKYNVEDDGEVMTETFEITLDDETLHEVMDRGILPVTGGDDVQFLSLEKTTEQLEASGWTIK